MSTPEHNFVEIFRASSAPQLEIIRLRLAEEGIPAFVDGELLVGLAGELPFGWQNSPRIMVDETREDEAVAIIREILVNKQTQNNKAGNFCLSCHFPFEENATRCSRCGWSFQEEDIPADTTEILPITPNAPKEVEIPSKIRWMIRIGIAVILAAVGYVGYKIVTDTSEEFENGIVALEKGHFDESIFFMSKVIRWDSKNAEARYYRSRAYYEKKQYDPALVDINEAIRIDRSPVFLDFRGSVYIALHNYEAALSDYNSVIELQKPDEITLHNRGYSHYMLKQYEHAIEDYQQSLKLKPTSYQVRLNLAYSYIRLERWKDAIEEGNKARETTYNNHVVLNFLSSIFSSCAEEKYRNGPLALEYAKKACEVDKKNPDYLDTLAAAYAENGQFDLAVEAQQKALADKNFAAGDADRDKALDKAKHRLSLYQNHKPLRLTGAEWE